MFEILFIKIDYRPLKYFRRLFLPVVFVSRSKVKRNDDVLGLLFVEKADDHWLISFEREDAFDEVLGSAKTMRGAKRKAVKILDNRSMIC